MSLGQRSGQLPRDEGSLWHDVVVSVADEKGIDPLDLSPPLASVVDVVAVERAIERSEAPVGVTFEYAGVTVEVRSESSVTVRDVEDGYH